MNSGSPLFLLQNMCIEFLRLDGDKELVPLPNSLLFSCFKRQRKFSETFRKSVASFCSYFLVLLTYFWQKA